MTKQPSDAASIETFGSCKTIEGILGDFRRAGTPTSAEHIEQVWASARARGDIMPCERPPEGFSQDQSALIQSFSGRP